MASNDNNLQADVLVANWRVIVLYTSLVALSFGSWWLLNYNNDDDIKAQSSNDSPDYFITNARLRKMNEVGHPEQRLTADRADHFPSSGVTRLTNPLMIFYDETKPGWQVEAVSGEIAADGQSIFLTGEVEITRAETIGLKNIRLVTKDLEILADKEYAQTRQAVHIQGKDFNLHGIGMQLWFNDPVRLRLTSKVRGNYEGS